MKRLDILEQDYRDAKNHLYRLAHNVCINGKEQAVLMTTLTKIEMHALNYGMEGKDIIKELLSCIYDGLAYDNWPWIKNGVNTLENK